MRQGAQTLADAQQDKYDRVLPIFKYGTLDQAKGVFPDMDEAIKKASVAITRHSIMAKGKTGNKVEERNAWIDDCYLLIGKCQFYKHDYWTAIETFQFTSSEYKNSPIRPEALLWLTKSYLELGKVTDAEYLLDYLKNDKKFPIELKGEYNATLALYHQLRNDVPRTIEALAAASATAKKKDQRARYTFILGQLYQRQGMTDSAFVAYEKVIKLNPEYEMAFNARINRARCYDVKSGSGELVKKELNKMLKDEKNEEFRDQILFALAGVARQESNEPLAITLLDSSLRVSAGNDGQKALDYLELADIYLKRPEYMPAAAYYDSALTNLNQDHPDYFEISEKRNSLDRLVRNLKIIIQEDSLQRLSKMSPQERASAIDSLIAREDAEKERLANAEKEKQRLEEEDVLQEKQLKSEQRSYNAPASANQGAWYFYNISAISFGYNEFLKKWGTRKLEDNWRRSDKEIEMETAVGEIDAIDSLSKQNTALNDSISKLDAGARKEAYLGRIPSGDQAMKESNTKIIEAYYNVGIIYREQIGNNQKSVESFETMNTRYPENKYKLPSYYNLYRTYLLMHDTVKADFYKNYLLTNYPESEYSKLILNPNFIKELQKKTAVLEVFYENTYNAYLNGQYANVIERKNEADQMFPPNNKLSSRFAFLRALAIGKTKPAEEFELALEDIIRAYPKDTISDLAKDMLGMIKSRMSSSQGQADSAATATQIQQAIDSSAFTFAPSSPQYFFILIKGNADVTALINRLRAFNQRNHGDENITITNGNLDLTYQYVSAITFSNKNAAMVYFNEVTNEKGLLDDMKNPNTKFFVISQDNLLELTRNKDVEGYANFFTRNYSQ